MSAEDIFRVEDSEVKTTTEHAWSVLRADRCGLITPEQAAAIVLGEEQCTEETYMAMVERCAMMYEIADAYRETGKTAPADFDKAARVAKERGMIPRPRLAEPGDNWGVWEQEAPWTPWDDLLK